MGKTYFLLGEEASDAFFNGGMRGLRTAYNSGEFEPILVMFEDGKSDIVTFAEAICNAQDYCVITEEEYKKIKKAYKL